MGNWRIKSKEQTTESSIMRPLGMGIAPEEYNYEVENTDTGDTRTVTAFNEDDLGKQIGGGLERDE